MSKKKLIVLGGRPIGSCELVYAAHQMGHYVIVADYLSVEESPAKRVADESWDVSTDDIECLKRLCISAGVNGVLAGVHEFNLQKMAALANELDLPCYCTSLQQQQCEDKKSFKEVCRVHGLDVAKEFTVEEATALPEDKYPLAVKPRDGSGSRGFTKCFSPKKLESAVEKARKFSPNGEVLIEEFIQSEALIAQYTGHSGEVYFCGLADKHSRTLGLNGAPIMALQVAPSCSTDAYLERIDPLVRKMLRSLGMVEGPIWIEIFLAGDRFIFNEIGYRFGGSLTYHLVKELYGVDQMGLLIDHALGENHTFIPPRKVADDLYIVWPLHLRSGKIASIEGLDWLRSLKEFVALTQVHWVNDEIADWGSAQQVFAYIHLKGSSLSRLIEVMRDILLNVHVINDQGNEILFSLFDPAVDLTNESTPLFLRCDLYGKR